MHHSVWEDATYQAQLNFVSSRKESFAIPSQGQGKFHVIAFLGM